MSSAAVRVEKTGGVSRADENVLSLYLKEINKIHVTAWKLGLKSLYYQHSMNAAQKFRQKKECTSCEA